MPAKVDVIMPTFDQEPGMFEATVLSMLATQSVHPFRLIVVNNGHRKMTLNDPSIMVINTGKNLGWEGGLKVGLEASDAPLVVFANDDLFFPDMSRWWMHDMAAACQDEKVGGVGPTSNCVMGPQHFFTLVGKKHVEVKFLIGFLVMYRRKVLDEVGGVPQGLPGGDDLDLGIRVRKAGYKLLCCREVFIWHHGFQTGIRVHGDGNTPGGWNSKEMTAKTNETLIKNHGQEAFDDLWTFSPNGK